MDIKTINVETVIVLGIGNGTFDQLFHGLGDAALAERQGCDSSGGRTVADQTGNQVQLARGDMDVA